MEYLAVPTEALLEVDARNRLEAEAKVRELNPELRGRQVSIVAASLVWERTPLRWEK